MNVPKIRFNEFKNEWQSVKIKDIADVIGGGTPSTENSNYWNGGIQWFTPSEIGKEKYVSKSIRTITEEGLNNSSAKLLPIGTILLSSRATIGEASILLNEASTNQGFQSLVVKKNYNNEYVYYLINKIKKDMLTKSFGSTFLEISKSNLEQIKVNIADSNEQKKIADFLSLLDKKIELQSKKIEALKLYKKGLVNKVFENSNIEKIVPLKSIGYSYTGLSGKTKDDFDVGNELFIPFISVLNNNVDLSNFRKVNVLDKTKQNKVEQKDLFFTVSSETSEEVGMCSTINKSIDNLYLNSFCFGFRLNNSDEVNNNYLCELLLSKKYRKIITNLGQGFTRVNISKNQILDIEVELPCIEEQNKISYFISIIKNKISLEESKLLDLQEFKKGLMQNMFV